MNEIPACFLQSTPIFTSLLAPRSTEEMNECRQLRSIIREMEPLEAELHPSEDRKLPLVRLRYTAVDMPQEWWSKYLWARVRTENGFGWLVRLGMIAQARHEMYFRVLSDRVEQSVAERAIRNNQPRVVEIRIGVITPKQYIRRFIF